MCFDFWVAASEDTSDDDAWAAAFSIGGVVTTTELNGWGICMLKLAVLNGLSRSSARWFSSFGFD